MEDALQRCAQLLSPLPRGQGLCFFPSLLLIPQLSTGSYAELGQYLLKGDFKGTPGAR